MKEQKIIRDEKGRFVKGFSGNQKTQFKKGVIPWTKGMSREEILNHKNKIKIIKNKETNGIISRNIINYRNRNFVKKCEFCKQTFKKLNEKFCSRKCYMNFNIKENHPMYGKKRPDQSEMMKLNNPMFNQEYINKIKEKRENWIIPVEDTSIEIKIQNFLKGLGYDFFTHQYIKINHGYRCDILIPSLNLVIECDGNYWHKYPIGTNIDHIRTRELLEKGFKVLRLWEIEIKEMDIDKFKEKIKVLGGNKQ